MSLRENIGILTNKFANQLTTEILNAIQTSSLNDLVEDGLNISATDSPVPYRPTAKATGTRKYAKTTGPRKFDAIKNTAKQIVAYVTKYPNTGAQDIRTALKINKAAWLATIAVALTVGLKKTGEKRATVYYTGAKVKAVTAKKIAKKASAAPKKNNFTKKVAKAASITPPVVTETPDVWPGDTTTNGAAVEATA